MAGRPTKLTPEVEEKVLSALRLGNYRKVAAWYAGVSYNTFCQWMTDGRKDPISLPGLFRQQVIEAEQSAEIDAVSRVKEAKPEWWLARKFPERWSETTKTELTGANGEPLHIFIQKITNPETE